GFRPQPVVLPLQRRLPVCSLVRAGGRGMAPHLLGEDEVKRAVRSYLKSLGYTQVRIKWGRAHGPDVRAKGPAGSLVLEAKGDASSQQHKTNNFVYALGQLVQRMDDCVVGY